MKIIFKEDKMNDEDLIKWVINHLQEIYVYCDSVTSKSMKRLITHLEGLIDE